MRKNYTSLLLLFVAFTTFAVYQSTDKVKKTNHQKNFGDADAIGSEEDAQARIEYERVRLCDPVTGKIPLYMREKELAYAATLPTDADISSSTNSPAHRVNPHLYFRIRTSKQNAPEIVGNV